MNPLSDLLLAEICANSYTNAAPWDHMWELNETHAAHKKIGELDVIVFRGSFDAEDWIHDVEAFPLWDMRLGFVHGGFMCGVNEIFDAAKAVVGSNVIVTGHSLGGARARLFAGLMAVAGTPVMKCTVFGSPRPAFVNLTRVLQKSSTPLASYRNRNDPVPLVPYMAGLYTHPDNWMPVSTSPGPDDLNPLRDHHIGLYVAALTALEPAPATTTPQEIPA